VGGPSVPEYLSVDISRNERGVVVHVRGEIDMASAPQLEAAIDRAREDRPEQLDLDLAEVDFIDISGLRVLINAYQRANKQGERLILQRASPPVRRLLALSSVSELIPVAEDAEDPPRT
jgi:anti-sigma B factor antagonist